MSGARRLSIGLIVLCQSTQNLAFGAVALFLPLIREDIGLTFSQAGSLAVATTATYAIMQIPAGYLADRFGARRLFVVGLLGTNAMSFGLALLQTYPLLLANQAVAGFFRSLVFAPGLALISAQFPSERRSTAMGLFATGGFASSILLNALGPVLVDALGWRSLFAILAITGGTIVGVYGLMGQRSPARGSASARPGIVELVRLLRHGVVLLAGVVQFIRLALGQAARFWLPTYIVVDKGYPLRIAGLIVAFGALITAPSNFLGGYISDRLQRPLLVVGVSLAALGTCFALLVRATSLPAIIAIVGIQSLFIQSYFGPLFRVPVQYLGERNAGTINGISNFCANLGGLLAAYMLGAVKDATGSFAPGFNALSLLCLVGLAATWLMSRLYGAGRPDHEGVRP